MREKAIKIKRKRCASDWFLDIFKVVFLVLVTAVSYTHLTLPTTPYV